MSLLIPSPHSHEKKIDIFMRPVIDELKQLWDEGVETYDCYSGKRFQMHVAVLQTISDFLTHDYLFGKITQGYNACHMCLDMIDS